MVDKASPVDVAEACVFLAIAFSQQEGLEQIVADEEVDDELDGEDEAGIGSEDGNGFIDEFSDMRAMRGPMVDFSGEQHGGELQGRWRWC